MLEFTKLYGHWNCHKPSATHCWQTQFSLLCHCCHPISTPVAVITHTQIRDVATGDKARWNITGKALQQQTLWERHQRSKNETSQGRGIVFGDVVEGTSQKSNTTHCEVVELQWKTSRTLWKSFKMRHCKRHCNERHHGGNRRSLEETLLGGITMADVIKWDVLRGGFAL